MLRKLTSEVELVGRHLAVVREVVASQPIGIMKLSEVLGLPAHRVRYSLRVLESQGYIRASSTGAVATPLASELVATLDEQIDDLITMLELMKQGTIP